GAELLYQTPRREEASGQNQKPLQLPRRADVLQPRRFNERKFKPGPRHESRLKSARRADEADDRSGVAAHQLLRHSDAGVDVPARAARGDEHAHAHHPRPGRTRRGDGETGRRGVLSSTLACAVRLVVVAASRGISMTIALSPRLPFSTSLSLSVSTSLSSPACCEMFKSTPTAKSVGTSDEPP